MSLIGYTDMSTVKLDIDKKTLKKTKRGAKRVCEWFKLEGYIILKSSSRGFHVLFNKPVSWKQNVSTMAWACYITNFDLPIMRYLVMQATSARVMVLSRLYDTSLSGN